MKRLGLNHHLLLVVLILAFPITTLFVYAQDSEPMANPECTSDNLADAPAQIDELYTEAQTAFSNGDVRTWLENLRAISWLTSSLRAFCDNYVFEGDAEGSNSQVFGPVIFQPGIYTVTATTSGYLIAQMETISGGCGRIPFSMIVSEGDATEGAQEIFRVEDEDCTALLEVSNLTAPWTLEFSFIASGE